MAARISAIISAYQGARFMPSRLDNLLAQSVVSELEIIIIDSGSPETESAIVESYQQEYNNIVLLRTPRENIYSSWNRALALASGKYVTNANLDDRLGLNALKVLADTLDADNDIGLVYADAYITKDEQEIISYRGQQRSDWSQLKWPDYSHAELLVGCLCGPQPMWRRWLHDEFGLFDTSYQVAGDYEFWLRIAERYKFAHLGQPLGLVLENSRGIVASNRHLLFDENARLRRRYFQLPFLAALAGPAGQVVQ